MKNKTIYLTIIFILSITIIQNVEGLTADAGYVPNITASGQIGVFGWEIQNRYNYTISIKNVTISDNAPAMYIYNSSTCGVRGNSIMNVTMAGGTTTALTYSINLTNSSCLIFVFGNSTTGSYNQKYIGYTYNTTTTPLLWRARWKDDTTAPRDDPQMVTGNYLESGYAIGFENYTAPAVPEFPDNISWISQTPSDITSTSLFTYRNITFQYNYYNTSLNYPYLNYTVNSSVLSCLVATNGSCSVYNGTYYQKNYSDTAVNTTNSSFYIYNFSLTENQIYPIRQNYDYNTISTYENLTLSVNDLFKDEILNISNLTAVNIYELPILTGTTGIARVYYYNGSYTTGNPATSTYTTELCTFSNVTTYNHTHGTIGHNLCIFTIVNGSVNGVKVNGGGFIIRRIAGTISLEVANESFRTGSGQYSNNNGLTYSENRTLLSHIHQFNNGTTLHYRAFGNYGGILQYENFTHNDTYALDPVPPQAPVITVPFGELDYRQYMNITYTNATPITGTPIGYYLIKLLDENSTTIATLVNNSLNNYYYWDTYTRNLTVNTTYFIRVEAYDNTTGLSSFDVESFSVVRNGYVNVTAYQYNGSQISNFSVNITDANASYTEVYSTNGTTATVDIIKENTVTLDFDSPLYAYISYTNVYVNATNTYTFYPLPSNSINITIRNEATNALITQNVTLLFEKVGSPVQYTYTTDTGNVFPEQLSAGSYTLTITSTTPVAYTVRYYSINITDRATQNLTAYLNDGGNVLLTYRNTLGETLSNVSVVVERSINGTFVTVESLYTQIDGRTQFAYLTNTRYRITSTLEGYDTSVFELNPVLFSSYDVTMYQTGLDVIEPTAYGIWTPKSFYKGQSGNITFKIFSPYDSLVNYSLSVYYNGVLFNQSNGTNESGEIFYIPYTTATAVLGDQITVNYSYALNNNATYNYYETYNIIVPLTNRTLIEMGDDTFGFGVGDRVLIVVFLNILAFGVGFLVAGTILGASMMIINTLIFVVNGFVPGGLFYATIVIGIIIIMGKGVSDG